MKWMILSLCCLSVFQQGIAQQSAAAPPPPKPGITRIEPPGLQRGVEMSLKVFGTNLGSVAQIRFDNTNVVVSIASQQPGELTLQVKLPPRMRRGSHQFWLKGPGGESNRQTIWVDDLSQVVEDPKSNLHRLELPQNFWGRLDQRGDVDETEFEVKAGQTVVFDLQAKVLGAKLEGHLALLDTTGKILASNAGFDGSTDPLLVHTFAIAGKYRLRISDQKVAGSPEHFYRLSAGTFPYVTGVFPLSVPPNQESSLELVGFNLPEQRSVRIVAGEKGKQLALPKPPKTKPNKNQAKMAPAVAAVPVANRGEVEVPVPPAFRSRREFKVLVGDGMELLENEPNDQPVAATKIQIPSAVGGRLVSGARAKGALSSPDVDHFEFEARAGQSWIIEVAAAQRGSPLDSKIEVLYPDGKPVPRLLLQAVRNSAVTFRGIDSITVDCRTEHWEEMELNEYLYLQGEVVRIFRMPQGPDSGFNFYSSNGKRRNYFDTTATAHPLDEPCYTVEPFPLGAKLVSNGLPVFTVNYVNDDESDRKLGTDSKLHFTAPADGRYVLRVSDTRQFSGDRFAYRLVVREPKPDFNAVLNGAGATIAAGSGQSFSVSVDRLDGFEGPIRVDISGLPPGLVASSPVVIEAGHNIAFGTINAADNAVDPGDAVANATKVTAEAEIGGKKITKVINNLGRLRVGPKPAVFVLLEPEPLPGGSAMLSTLEKPAEITLAPGQMVPARLKVRRNGFNEVMTFTVDNLPHGVIVDNIGLNGVLIPKDQTERQIFLTAAKWVEETDRLCYAIENQSGRQTSLPVLIKIRKQKVSQNLP